MSAFADTREVFAWQPLARITLVTADESDAWRADSGHMAAGLALALARGGSPTGNPTGVALIELDAAERALRALGSDAPRELVVDSPQLGQALQAVEAARARRGTRQVVVHLPAGPAQAQLIDALRPLPHTVVWLNRDADGWWSASAEAPTRVIRVDRLDRAFVAALRRRSERFTRGQDPSHTLADDRPGVRVQHQARVPDDPAAFRRAREGGVAAALDRAGDVCGEAYWRVARMVRRKSVGLALGGGGAWGAAHVGVLRAFQAAGVPIDYVAGTSFGSVIGAIYAGGGLPALQRMGEENRLPKAGRRSRLARALLPAPLKFFEEHHRSRRTPLGAAFVSAQLGNLARVGEEVARLAAPSAGDCVSLGELPVPFFPVASDLSTHTAWVPHWIDLRTAVQASGSLPPAFPSMRVRGAVVTDGAPLANVPATALREVGADFVIAVNVVGARLAPPDTSGTEAAMAAHSSPSGGLRGLALRARDTWIVGWLTLRKAGVDQALHAADVLVDVHVRNVPLSAVWRIEELAGAAEAASLARGFGAQVGKHYEAGEWRTGAPLRLSTLIDPRAGGQAPA